MFIANKVRQGMEKLTTRKQYDEVRARVENLIAEVTEKGMLEPNMDNEYTQEIACRQTVESWLFDSRE